MDNKDTNNTILEHTRLVKTEENVEPRHYTVCLKVRIFKYMHCIKVEVIFLKAQVHVRTRTHTPFRKHLVCAVVVKIIFVHIRFLDFL